MASAQESQELQVELDTTNREWMRRDQALRLRVNRAPAAGEGRLAIVVGDTDVTDLVAAYEGVLEYRPAPVPLRAGEYDVAVYLVPPQGEWREIARLPIRVRTASGLERRSFTPKLDVQGLKLLDESVHPEQDPGADSPDAASLNLQLGGDAERSGWRFKGASQMLGVTEAQNALRFAQEGVDAPRFDLSDYSLRYEHVEDTNKYFALGHVSYNQHRHLIPAFSSRGTMLGARLGNAGSMSFAALNGTSVAGWNNFFGLANNKHRVMATRLGFELRPKRPGALRVDADYLDGSLQPENNFNGANIGDAQTNRGWGLRLAGSTPAGRLRFEAGYARSAFENPSDPSLSQGLDLVPVAREERGAQYLDVDWTLLQGKAFGNQRQANLSLALRHERIDPQYASVAATLQADQLRNSVQLGGSSGPLQFQASYSQLEDNLDGIRTILTTRTRRTDAMFSLPLAELFRPGKTASWLPSASYTFNRVHQFGAGVPPDSGFNASHVPDQLSDQHLLSLDWRGQRWSLGYRVNASDQDNRQPGREQSDFQSMRHALTTSFNPHPRLDLNLELSRDRNYAAEQGTVTRTRNAGAGFRLSVTGSLVLSATAGLTRSEDDPRTSESENSFLDASLTYRFEWSRANDRGLAGQLFLRYADRAQQAHDELFGFDTDSRTRTVVGGVNFNLR
jgi:hypothetical protein